MTDETSGRRRAYSYTAARRAGSITGLVLLVVLAGYAVWINSVHGADRLVPFIVMPALTFATVVGAMIVARRVSREARGLGDDVVLMSGLMLAVPLFLVAIPAGFEYLEGTRTVETVIVGEHSEGGGRAQTRFLDTEAGTFAIPLFMPLAARPGPVRLVITNRSAWALESVPTGEAWDPGARAVTLPTCGPDATLAPDGQNSCVTINVMMVTPSPGP